MAFVSVTRLRIRSWRFLPAFAVHTQRSMGQLRRAEGFLEGALLPDGVWTYWTATVWEGMENMRGYRNGGAHLAAMAKLMGWCDEASVVHWEQAERTAPGWVEADRRMRLEGRVSKVRWPSADHAAMRFRAPWVKASTRIAPARR